MAIREKLAEIVESFKPEEMPSCFFRVYDLFFNRFYDRLATKLFMNVYKKIAGEVVTNVARGRIIDLGTGAGYLPIEICLLSSDIEVTGIDMRRSAIEIARRNAKMAGVDDRVRFKVASVYDSGFEDNSFDFAVSTGVVHELRYPLKMFNEAYRILKKGSKAWMYDGRTDATLRDVKDSIEEMGIPFPYPMAWFIFPFIHAGLRTEVWNTRIRRDIEKSLFEEYKIEERGALVRIALKKV